LKILFLERGMYKWNLAKKKAIVSARGNVAVRKTVYAGF
jgi:hypothetical protein